MSDEPVKPKRRVRPDAIGVEYQLVGSEERIPATLGKITVAGGLLRSDRPLELGARMRIFIAGFEEDVSLAQDEEIAVRAVTRWERQGTIGVQFWRSGEREVRILMEIIAAMEKAMPQRATPADPDAFSTRRR